MVLQRVFEVIVKMIPAGVAEAVVGEITERSLRGILDGIL